MSSWCTPPECTLATSVLVIWFAEILIISPEPKSIGWAFPPPKATPQAVPEMRKAIPKGPGEGCVQYGRCSKSVEPAPACDSTRSLPMTLLSLMSDVRMLGLGSRARPLGSRAQPLLLVV
jgi:hypothetical protein